MGFKHAPGPWVYKDDHCDGSVYDADDFFVLNGDEWDPDIRRLINCVNACEGWSIEDLKRALREDRERYGV